LLENELFLGSVDVMCRLTEFHEIGCIQSVWLI